MAVIMLHYGKSIFPKQIICLSCGAFLEIEHVRDLEIVKDQSLERIPGVKCPSCGNRVVLYEADRDQALAEYDKAGEWR